MTPNRRQFLVPALTILAVAGCGTPSGDADREASATSGGEETASTAPASETRPPAPAPPARANPDGAATPGGVPLSHAAPAPSALSNAAFQRVEQHWEQVLFLCDGVDGIRVKLITMPNAKGLSTLWTYRKPDFRTDRATVRLSDEDPGAGQIMRGIERPDGSSFGSVHSVNPGMLGDATETTLPTLRGITDKRTTTRCRWEPRGRVLLVDARRSVLVTADAGGGYTYKSFDYAKPGKVIDAGGGATSVPTTTVGNGRLVPADPGHEVYEFRKGPWTYRVSASADSRAPGASLTVLRDGKPVQMSVAAAYEMAAKRIE